MAIEDFLSAPVVKPVHIGFFDIKDDPLYGWTGEGAFAPIGTGDADLDNNIFLATEGAVNITDFTEDQGMGDSISITFAISEPTGGFILGESQLGVDPLGTNRIAMFDQLVLDRRLFMGRKAVIWLGFLIEPESGDEIGWQPEEWGAAGWQPEGGSYVSPDIQRMFTGVMVGASIQRQVGQPTTITLICDQDLQKAATAPVRWIDHQVFYPTDTASTFINSLSRGAIATAREFYGDYGEGPGSFQRYIRDEMRRG
jgi:hypothetical protein